MTDNVTNIRDAKGRFPKGKSGNPEGVSGVHAAIKQMQRENEVLLSTLITKMVPGAARLHRALLRSKSLTTKEAIELIHLTYRYGIGTPRQAEPVAKADDNATFDLEMSDEKRDAIMKLLSSTAKDAGSE